MIIVTKYDLPESLLAPKWKSDQPSLTVPDQTLSVRELLERFTTGLLTPQSVWHEDVGDDFSDLDNPNPSDSPDFDLVDRDELRQQAELARQSIVQTEERRQRRRRSNEEEVRREEERSDDEQRTRDE